ncbi:MAG: hypothetical protein RL227_1263 [Pseudomonadota bacterium]
MPRAPAHSTDHLDTRADDVTFAERPGLSFDDCASANYSFGSKIELVSEREWKTAEEAERFYSERLDIEIHQTGDRNAPIFAEVGINGHMVWFPRGQRINNVPRRFVESLARSQDHTFRSVHERNPDVDSQMKTLRTRSTAYGLSILRDPNPKGREWLERVVREG